MASTEAHRQAQRRYRLKHPERAAADLAKIIGKPRRPKITAPPEDDQAQRSDLTPEENAGITEPITEEHTQGQDAPPPDAPSHRTVLLSLISDLEAIAALLKDAGNAPPVLRLRADVTSRLIHAHDRLSKLPPATQGADDWIKAYQTPPAAPLRAKRGAVRPVSPAPTLKTPRPEPAPEPDPQSATHKAEISPTQEIAPTGERDQAPEPLSPDSLDF